MNGGSFEFVPLKVLNNLGRGGCGQVVSLLSFYSANPNSNPAEVNNNIYCVKLAGKERK